MNFRNEIFFFNILFKLLRDLKLEHAIVGKTGMVRLIDYGLARVLETPGETCYTYCGTHGYMAPEVNTFS